MSLAYRLPKSLASIHVSPRLIGGLLGGAERILARVGLSWGELREAASREPKISSRTPTVVPAQRRRPQNFCSQLNARLEEFGMGGAVWRPLNGEPTDLAWSGANRHEDRIIAAKQLANRPPGESAGSRLHLPRVILLAIFNRYYVGAPYVFQLRAPTAQESR